jgi:hypothetical protein
MKKYTVEITETIVHRIVFETDDAPGTPEFESKVDAVIETRNDETVWSEDGDGWHVAVSRGEPREPEDWDYVDHRYEG